MNVEYKFTNKVVTPWGGMVFLKQFLDRIGLKDQVNRCQALPQPGSNRGYSPLVILEAFICSIWCGANRFLHTEVTRSDRALAGIFGWKRVPGQDTYKRFFGKFTQSLNQQVADHFYRWIFSNLHADNFTLDLDSSVITRYGSQQGAKKGYNPSKKGRPSHHPIIAFINDVKLVANMWLRSGDASASNNVLGFLEDTLAKLAGKKVSLIRLDSGFFGDEVLSYLEDHAHRYIVAARFYHPIQRLIGSRQNWLVLDEGIEVCELSWQGDKWKAPRRMIVVRQHIAQRPKAAGKTLSLFADEQEYRHYRYSAYFTNLEFGAAEIWRLYRGRGDAENRIKELKYDFGFDSFNLHGFYPTEAALTFAMIAYNLMAIFRMFVLQEKTQKHLSTLRYRTFAIGAYFEKVKGKIVLRIALTKKRRKWFASLWDYPIEFPIHFSNA